MLKSPTKTHKSIQNIIPVFGLVGATIGSWVLFLHLMQSNAAFAEAVAKISPEIANRYSCGCPLCQQRVCTAQENQIGMNRLDGRIDELFSGLPPLDGAKFQ
jgi:hypothetical protein